MWNVELPWPPRALNGHAKGGWRPKATATRSYRHLAKYWALAQKVRALPNAVLEFRFHPPDRRRRDIQNMPGMMKPAIDGIADAMKCDDNGFRPRFPDHFDEPVKGGKVVIMISKLLEE